MSDDDTAQQGSEGSAGTEDTQEPETSASAEDRQESAASTEPEASEESKAAADRIAEAQAAMEEVRRQIAAAPPETVVANHAMGLFELAAIHLSAEQPNLKAATLAIDAMACLVDGLGDRLGPDVATLRDALANIRFTFVKVKERVAAQTSGEPKPSSDGD